MQQAFIDWPTPRGLFEEFWQVVVSQSCTGDKLAKWCLEFGSTWGPDDLRRIKSKDKPGMCYANAGRRAIEDPDLVYVEGYACTDSLHLPVQHAWLLDETGRIIDTTWSNGVNYCGVPIKASALHEILDVTKRWGVFGWGTPKWVIEHPERVVWTKPPQS